MQRQLALDGAKGFSVLFIPAVHCFLAFGQPETHHSLIADVLRAIAEGPGVHVFLIIMGIVFTFKQRHTHAAILKRSALLLLAGYALNTLKFIIPYLIGGLPVALQQDLQLIPGHEVIQLLLMGDIFHCAAIALLIIHFMYRVRNYWLWSIFAAMVCVVISPLVSPDHPNYLAQLFIGAPPRIFFPVVSWLPYPLLGLTIGYGLRRRKNETIKYLGMTGSLITIIAVIMLILCSQFSEYGYYRPQIIESLAHIGIVLLYQWLWFQIIRRIPQGRFVELLQFSSENITTFYCIQWIFICWLIPFTGYQTMNLQQTVMMAIYTTAISLGITYFITHYKTIYK